MSTNPDVHVLGLKADEGEARWWLGSLAIIKAGGSDTGGRFALIDLTEPTGAEAPLHVHPVADESFWILEGSLTFEVGDTTIQAEPGSFLFGPKGVPHRYQVDAGPARLLVMLSPAGFEELVLATSEPAESRVLPPPINAAPDPAEWEQFATIAKQYGCEFLV